MNREEGESAIEFANRVKTEIANKGGLVELGWDGQLKRQKVKPEWVKQQQLKFSQSIDVTEVMNDHHTKADSTTTDSDIDTNERSTSVSQDDNKTNNNNNN